MKKKAFLFCLLSGLALLAGSGCCHQQQELDPVADCNCPDDSYECNNYNCNCPDGTFDLGVRCAPYIPTSWIATPDCACMDPMILDFGDYLAGNNQNLDYMSGYGGGQMGIQHYILPEGDSLYAIGIGGPFVCGFDSLAIWPRLEGRITPDQDSMFIKLTYHEPGHPQNVYQTCDLIFHH